MPLGNRREGNERCACDGKGCAAVIEMSFSVDEVALSVTLFGCTRGDTSFVSKGHSRWRGRDVRNLNDVECHNGPARGSGVEPYGSLSHLARDESTAAKSNGFCNVVVRTLERNDDRERLAYRTALIESESPRSRASDRHAKQDTSSSCSFLRPNAHCSFTRPFSTRKSFANGVA